MIEWVAVCCGDFILVCIITWAVVVFCRGSKQDKTTIKRPHRLGVVCLYCGVGRSGKMYQCHACGGSLIEDWSHLIPPW